MLFRSVGISGKGKATGIQIGGKTIEDLTNKIKENVGKLDENHSSRSPDFNW